MPKDWSRPFSPRQCQTLFVKVCGLSLDDSNLTLGTSIKMEEKQRLRPRKLTKGAHGVVPERKLHPAATRTSHVNTGLFREAWISYVQVPPQQEQNPRGEPSGCVWPGTALPGSGRRSPCSGWGLEPDLGTRLS